MSSMTGQQLGVLFRALVDDSDFTFFSQADVATALQLGYNEYVTYIANQVPTIYEKPYNFTLSGQGEYDLNGILFGPPTTLPAPPLVDNAYRLTRMHSVNNGQFPDMGYWLTATDTLEELWNVGPTGSAGVYNRGRWLLQGTKLMFSAQLTGTYRLYYLPAPTIDWAAAIATPNVFIDNTSPYQQLIAYFAVQSYAIRDWAENPALERKMGQLLQQLDRWLVKGRSGDSHKWVTPSRTNNRGGW